MSSEEMSTGLLGKLKEARKWDIILELVNFAPRDLILITRDEIFLRARK